MISPFGVDHPDISKRLVFRPKTLTTHETAAKIGMASGTRDGKISARWAKRQAGLKAEQKP